MEPGDKELLIKDLCGRLPYGVRVVIQDNFKYSIVSREYHTLDVSNFSDIVCFNYKKFDKCMKKAMKERPNDIVIKPYLFPLSSMTEEQKKEYAHILVMSSNLAFSQILDMTVEDWFNKNHFDFRGLIPKGLANDATGLNIYESC